MNVRPAYESQADRNAEREIADAIAQEWGVRAHKLKRFYPIDFALFQTNTLLHSWLEVKCRRLIAHDTYRDIILSLHKVSAGIQFAHFTCVLFHFAVAFRDGIYIVELDEHRGYPIRLEGRTDRNDQEDIEPCACIPVSAFRRLL
jgi:hypothetical protein